MKHLLYAMGVVCLSLLFSSCENANGIEDNKIEIPKGVLYYSKSSGDSGYLEKVYADGSNKSQVRTNALMTQYPVGGKIVYNVIDKDKDIYKLCTANYDGTNEKVVSEEITKWSIKYITPNDRYLITYYDNENKIISYDKVTGKEIILSSNAAYETMNELSPDGSKIAYQEKTDNYTTGILYVVNVDGTGKIKLTDNSHHENDLLYFGSWSKDSKYLATVDDSRTKVYIFSADGTNQYIINNTAGEVSFPAISPDNNLVTYCEAGNIILNNFQGNNPKMIAAGDFVNGIECNAPVFSPDGKNIAYFRSDANNNVELYYYNIISNETKLITKIEFNGPSNESLVLPRIYWF